MAKIKKVNTPISLVFRIIVFPPIHHKNEKHLSNERFKLLKRNVDLLFFQAIGRKLLLRRQ